MCIVGVNNVDLAEGEKMVALHETRTLHEMFQDLVYISHPPSRSGAQDYIACEGNSTYYNVLHQIARFVSATSRSRNILSQVSLLELTRTPTRGQYLENT
jgi:hypothetical protein